MPVWMRSLSFPSSHLLKATEAPKVYASELFGRTPFEIFIDNVEFARGQNVRKGGKFYVDPRFDL